MIRILLLLSCMALCACTTNPTRVVAKTEAFEVPTIRYVAIPRDLVEHLPAPAEAPLTAVWLDPATGEKRPTADVGAITAEVLELRPALAVCYGNLDAIATIKPKEN